MALPTHDELLDGEIVKIPVADGGTLIYKFDAETRTFTVKDAFVITGRHGSSHISDDPIPSATCANPGLMSANDKCKLDAIAGTRIGILGFQGAGFPDDGGWLQGDVILASGSEAISIERVGNVVRFVVDIPSGFACGCEECNQIYWIQDETDTNAIRPPSCNGKLPGVNGYGELKFYLFPENTIVNTANSANVLSAKGTHPSLVFKRYDDGLEQDAGEFEMTLTRNSNTTTKVGWAMTPGASTKAECVWFMGLDDSQNLITFKLNTEGTDGILGSLLYKGHSITKQMAIITSVPDTAAVTNTYKGKIFDVITKTPLGDEFDITNIPNYDVANSSIVLDSDLGNPLAVGQVVDLWTVDVGTSTQRYYCQESATININGLWSGAGAIEFGEGLSARGETGPTTIETNDVRLLENSEWGMTNLEVIEPFSVSEDVGEIAYRVNIVSDEATELEPSERRYLEVPEDSFSTTQRPVHIWNRDKMRDGLFEIHFARPDEATLPFPPIDVLFRAPIDNLETKYGHVMDSALGAGGITDNPFPAGTGWFRVSGVPFNEIPERGAVKVIYNTTGPYTAGEIFTYTRKLIFPSGNEWDTVLVADFNPEGESEPVTVPDAGDVIEFLHEDYTSPALRLAHTFDGSDITMQAIVGTLDVSVPYDGFVVDVADVTNNGVGLIRITTATPHGWSTGQNVTVSGVGGVTNANGDWVITVIDSTNFDLVGSTFLGIYTTGGSVDIPNTVLGFAPGYAVGSVNTQSGTTENDPNSVNSAPEGFVIFNGGVLLGTENYNVLKVMVKDQKVWIYWNDLLLPPSPSLSAALPTPVAISSDYFTFTDEVQEGKFGLRLWPGAKVRRVILDGKIQKFDELS